MEAERLSGACSRKVLSWCLALMLCVQMLGTSAVRAFADEASDAVAAASENLGKNLVYDDVYGVKHGGFALMAQRGVISDGSGNASWAITQVDLVDSSGAVLTSFGMDDVPSLYVNDIGKADCVSSVRVDMQWLMMEEFSFYCVPKNVDDKVKYGFASYGGDEIAPCRYDRIIAKWRGEPLVAALDLGGSVVDVYSADGTKVAAISMPSGWSEKGSDANIYFMNEELCLNVSSGHYVWDTASNSFVLEDSESVGGSERVWNLPDGGTVTIAKIDGEDACTCTTPDGSFVVRGNVKPYWFDVFAEDGLIQYTFSTGPQIWDFSGAEVTTFQGDAISAYMGDGRYLCRNSSAEGLASYSIRQTDGTVLKSLPGTQYGFASPFINGTSDNGDFVILDSLGNEVKRIASPSTKGDFYFGSSAVDEVLVLKREERGGNEQGGNYPITALTAYDKASGEWLSAEVATAYARAFATILPDDTRAYLVPVYDHDNGLVNTKALPVYYRYVDRDLNVLSPYDSYNMQSAYTNWIQWQQTERTLADGMTMRYSANESGKYGAIDSEGTVLIPFEYDAYYDCGDDDSLILLKKDGAWEFFDTSTIDTGKEPVPATSVTISDAPEQLPVGETAQLTVTVAPEDSTDKVKWASSDESVLTVSAGGLVTAVANGDATVIATAGGQTDSVSVTVTTPATSVTIAGAPESPLPVGSTVQLSAVAKPDDTTDEVLWASSDENVLTVDADGLVTALGNGKATITATAGDQVDSITVTVVTPASGVELDAESLTLYIGGDASKLTARVLPAIASDKDVLWASSDDGVVTVDGDGVVFPAGVGSATVTATTVDGGFTASCAVTVGEHVSGIELDKGEISIIGAGTAELRATVSPDAALDKSVTWSTSDASVATVDESGLVTATGKGSAVVTATSTDGDLSASCKVSVGNPVTRFELSAASVALTKGDAQTVRAAARGDLPGEVDDCEVTLSVEGEGSFANGVWSDASGKAVFGVEEAASEDGMSRDCAISALGSGKGTLVFEAQQGRSTARGVVAVMVTNPAQAVTLSETSKQVAVGDGSFTLKATVDPVNADEADDIAWSTSNAAVVTVEAGVVTPVSAGSAVVTAKAGDVSATCAVTVTTKQIAATEDGSAYRASVEVADSAAAKRLEQIARDNGGSLALVVQSAQDLTEAAQKAIASLQDAQGNVAGVLDVFFRGGTGDGVSVDLSDDGLSMTVRVRMTDAMRALDAATLKVSHVADDGAVESKRTWVEGDDLCFVTEHFSMYVVTGSKPSVPGGGSEAGESQTGAGGASKQASAAATPLLAPTGDTAALPLALTGCAVAAALVCVARVRSGRRMK